MGQNISAIISEVENQWLDDLTAETERLFNKTCLPSHDLSHHIRVWTFSVDLLKAYSNSGYNFSRDFVEALAVAVFFHDTGLTVTTSARHGYESKLLAEAFLKNKYSLPEKHQSELLQAIEWHDDKNYKAHRYQNVKPDIYLLLTLADDLDALGCLGLLRYLEIYRKRKISPVIILQEIKTNLDARYSFMEQQLQFNSILHSTHTQRYNTASKMLKKLGISQLNYFFCCFESQLTFKQLINYSGKDKLISQFLSEVSKEMERINSW